MIEVVLAAVGETAIEVGGGKVRRKPDRLIVVGDGAVEIRFLVKDVAAHHESAGVGRIKLDRCVQIADGAVQIVLAEAHAAAIRISALIVGIELDRLAEIVQRAGEVALCRASPCPGCGAGWRDWATESGRNRSAPCRTRCAPRCWRVFARCSGVHRRRLARERTKRTPAAQRRRSP